MKRILHVLAALALMQASSQSAPVSIPGGGLVYIQNFNNLAVSTNNGASATTWADDSTIPGWWLYRAGNGTPIGFAGTGYSYRVGDGAVAPTLGQFYSMGTAGNTDRALAAPSTTAQGELAAIAVFRNTGTSPVELTRLKYNVEVRRANDGANNAESVAVWWRPGNSLAEIQAITTAVATTAVFPPGSASSPTSHYITGWNRLSQAELSYSNPVASQAVNVSMPVDIVPAPPIRVEPGKFFAIRFGNINDAGADALMGIDDLELTFSPIAAAVDATFTAITRNDSGTPSIPDDDTVDFTLTVSGIGNVSPSGWTIPFPAALAGQTGAYGTPKRLTGVPILEFSPSQHTADIYIEDQGNPALYDFVSLTAPWCVITPVISNIIRDDRGTDSPFDDLWGYTLRVDGLYTGSHFISSNSSIPDSPYGTTFLVKDLAVALDFDSATFTDNLEPSCTATITAWAPRIIGLKKFGVITPLFNDSNGIPSGWSVDEDGPGAQTINNGGGGAPKVYRSEVIDLSGLASSIKFTANLRAVDTSAGFEANDTFNAQLLINGTTTVSLITAFDANRNGVINGGTGAADDEFNATHAADGSYTSNFPLSYVIPATATSVQLIVSGITDSANETISLQSVLFEISGHAVALAPAATGSQFNNKGTVDPLDDEYTRAINVIPVNAPGGSTGWTSNLTPAFGAYSDPGPVQFGPFLQSAGTQNLTVTDNGAPAVSSQMEITPPVPAIEAALVNSVINTNGPGFADDTLSLLVQVSAKAGGPEFRVDAHPLETDAPGYPLTNTPTMITVHCTGAPDHGIIYVTLYDPGYPESRVTLDVAVPSANAAQYILGHQNAGGGATDILSLAGSSLPPEWQNFNRPPALQMTNGGGAPAKTITSEIIDLSAFSGPVRFSATLHVRDTDNGFESSDTFQARLILNGNTAAPVSLITLQDTNQDGVLSGAELCPSPAASPAVQDREYTLTADIPGNINTAQLILTAANDASTEIIWFENVLLSPGSAGGDTDNDGIPDEYEDANGLNKNSAADKNLDLDGDGQSNLNEFLAGTSANNPASSLKITERQLTGSTLNLTWNSVPGKTYRIDTSTDFTTWTDLGTDFPASAAAQTTAPVTLTTPRPGKFFLRVRVK